MELENHLKKLWQLESRKWLLVVGAMALTHILIQFLLLPYGTALRSLLPDSPDKFFDRSSLPLFRYPAKYTTLRNPLTVENADVHDIETMRKTTDAENGILSENEDRDNLVEFLEDNGVNDDNGDIDNSPVPREETFDNPFTLVLARNGGKSFPIKTAMNRKANPKQHSKSNSSSDGSRNSTSSNNTTKSITLINEMNHILERNHRSSCAMRPKWSSPRDGEILAAKAQIENALDDVNDRDLYAPLFRNVSKFKRSYELMEQTLKIYIYKDGKRPIFHKPVLKGLYASEGWFMKLMRGNKRFVVKDPQRAHLFYMPFSSHMLERNSHNRTNPRQYLKEYAEKIAAKYPYFNRTNGADHFLVACHDWAPYKTRHHMEQCIKALCNPDFTGGFKIGRDVSLPETYVRSSRNPQPNLGGRPSSQSNILAFYAGTMRGHLRRILLDHWKDKDDSIKITGPMSPANYVQHMKSSKYCICPKGYKVNSPRIVESIFYECVPVIISDNFVPPFFEVLNWDTFSVIIAEKDIPNLKDILTSIPNEKYLQLQLGVRKVQRHFLWHTKPVKYDLFSMTLHSIWYNRVHQVKQR